MSKIMKEKKPARQLGKFRQNSIVVAVLILAALLVGSSTPAVASEPPNGGLRFYDTNHSPVNSEGFTEVWAAINEGHCGTGAASGVTHMYFEGNWRPGGSFVRRVRVYNGAGQPMEFGRILHHDAGGDFPLPGLTVYPHQWGTLEINRHITGGYSVFYFTAIRGVNPCGASGSNSWKFSSVG